MAAKARRKKSATSVAGTQTLVRALDILDCLREEADKPLTLLEVSRAVDLSVSTTHRLLRALTLRGMVAQEGGRMYTLGPRLLQLAGSILHGADDLVALVTPALHRLRTITGETTSAHAILGEARVCLAELVSLQPIRMESGVGQVYPLNAGAAGKVLLAWGAGTIEDVDSASPSKVKESLPVVRRPGSGLVTSSTASWRPFADSATRPAQAKSSKAPSPWRPPSSARTIRWRPRSRSPARKPAGTRIRSTVSSLESSRRPARVRFRPSAASGRVQRAAIELPSSG